MSKFREYISKIRGSKDGKVLIANFGYLTLLQIATYIFPLITLPYLARVLGVDAMGKLAFSSAVIVWIQTICDWGFNYSATREVAKHRDDPNIVSTVFSTVFWARCCLMVLSLIVLSILILLFPTFRNNAQLLYITFLIVPGTIMFPDWFFQAMEKMKYITWLNIILRLVFTIAIFLFIKTQDDYILQPLLLSLGYIIAGIIALYIIIFDWKIKLRKIPIRAIINSITNSTNIFINNLLPNFYNSFSYILLGFISTDTSTGLYNAGRKLPEVCNRFLNVFTRVFFPYFARKTDNHALYAKLNISLSVLCAIGMILLANPLIRLFYGVEFMPAVVVLRITAVSVVFNTLNSVYGMNYLLVCGQDKLLRNLTAISSLIGFVISFPLAHYFDYIGVSCSFLIATILMGILPMIYAKRIIKQTTK